MMKTFISWSVMMAAAVLPLSAYGTLIHDDNFGYSTGGGDAAASVHSWVLFDDIDTYTYYYQILNVSPGYKVHYLQFNIPSTDPLGLNFGMSSSIGGYSGDIPVFGSLFEEGGIAYGVGAFATTPITAGQSSWIVYYQSDLAPLETSGLLSGFDPAGADRSFSGSVYTPIPEPATVLLLAAGAGYVMRMKRTKTFY